MPAYIMIAINPESFQIAKVAICSEPTPSSVAGEVWTQYGQTIPGLYQDARPHAIRYIQADPRVSRIFARFAPHEIRSGPPENRYDPIRSNDVVCFHDEWITFQPYGSDGPTICTNCRQQVQP